MWRKYTFRDFGGRTTDPNAFQCNSGKREVRETEGGVGEKSRKKSRHNKAEKRELQAI